MTGKIVIFYATEPDGNLIFNDCKIEKAANGIVTLQLTSQMSIVPGIMRDCEFHILDEELTKLKIKGLSIEIARCTDFETAIESTSEFTALTQALDEVNKVMEAYSEENIMSMDGEGQWQPTSAEKYYSAEAALLMAYKWSNNKLWSKLISTFKSSSDENLLKAVENFELRKEQNSLPEQLDKEHKVSQFINGNYAEHRFLL